MGYVYRYTPYFFYVFFYFFFLFINTHEYAKAKKLHISTLNEKTMSGLELGFKFGSLG